MIDGVYFSSKNRKYKDIKYKLENINKQAYQAG